MEDLRILVVVLAEGSGKRISSIPAWVAHFTGEGP